MYKHKNKELCKLLMVGYLSLGNTKALFNVF